MSTDQYTIALGTIPSLPVEENAESDARNRPCARAGREEDAESDAGSGQGDLPLESADFDGSSSESSKAAQLSEPDSEPAVAAAPTPRASGFNLHMQDPPSQEILGLHAKFVETTNAGDYMSLSWTVKPRSCMLIIFLHPFDTLDLHKIWKMVRASYFPKYVLNNIGFLNPGIFF